MHNYTKEEFVEKARKIHGEIFDYDKTIYVNAHVEIIVTCKKHGDFPINPNRHISNKQGCPDCASENKKVTKEQFLERAIIKHGDRHDYTNLNYIDYQTKTEFYCKVHGSFPQTPIQHLNSNGCKKCNKFIKIIPKEDIIKRLEKIFEGENYDFSLVEYKNNKTPIKVICPVHGVFENTLMAFNKGVRCDKCRDEEKNITTESFKKRGSITHNNKFDYSKVICDNGQKSIVIITCPIHGDFPQNAASHLLGKGCKKCSYEARRNTKEYFVSQSNKKHGVSKYGYDESNYIDASTPVSIMCFKHGLFPQEPKGHMSGQGCPTCNESKGEKGVREFLLNNNIKFEFQKTFDDCRFRSILFFDFYLPDHNMFIEFDGRQHFEVSSYFGGEEGFKELQLKDEIKNKYAVDNNIEMFRIHFKDLKNINKILKAKFNL